MITCCPPSKRRANYVGAATNGPNGEPARSRARARRSGIVLGFGCRPVIDLYSRGEGRHPKASEEGTRGGW
jgi:hypothetical protein